MPYAVAKDSVRLHYEEAGSGTPIIFLQTPPEERLTGLTPEEIARLMMSDRVIEAIRTTPRAGFVPAGLL